jgi:hypothetical protein
MTAAPQSLDDPYRHFWPEAGSRVFLMSRKGPCVYISLLGRDGLCVLSAEKPARAVYSFAMQTLEFIFSFCVLNQQDRLHVLRAQERIY